MIVVTEGNRVVMYSEDGIPTPGIGQVLRVLSAQQAKDLRDATQTRNDGLLFDGETISTVPEAEPMKYTQP